MSVARKALANVRRGLRGSLGSKLTRRRAGSSKAAGLKRRRTTLKNRYSVHHKGRSRVFSTRNQAYNFAERVTRGGGSASVTDRKHQVEIAHFRNGEQG